MNRWFRTHPKAETLFYSCIWLVFLAFPVVEALRMPNEEWEKWARLAAIATFVALYVRMWIVYPTVPPSDYRVPRGVVLTVVAMCGLHAVLVAAIDPINVRNMQLGIYIASVIAYTLPPKQFLLASFVFLVFIFVESGWLICHGHVSRDDVGASVALVLVMLGIFYSFARLLASHRSLALAHETIQQLTRNRERERIGADLHDVLGQSLTAIALKSRLAGKLLEGATPKRLAQARREIDEITRLSRSALADVRAVVRDTRRLTLDGEVLAAREVLLAAGVKPVVAGEPFELGESAQWAAAHVVREAVANVVHHSLATRCDIRTWATGVSVEDDGIEVGASDGGGTGLWGLSARIADAGGRLEYGRGIRGWRVRAEFGPGPDD